MLIPLDCPIWLADSSQPKTDSLLGSPRRSLRVLDVGCGPGDAGRIIHSRFPHARVDFVDRNEFFAALCDAVNRRDGIGGRTWVRDLSEPDWRRDLASNYDVAVAVNAVLRADGSEADHHKVPGSQGLTDMVAMLQSHDPCVPVLACEARLRGLDDAMRSSKIQHDRDFA